MTHMLSHSGAASQEINEIDDAPISEHISGAAVGEDTKLDLMKRPSAAEAPPAQPQNKETGGIKYKRRAITQAATQKFSERQMCGIYPTEVLLLALRSAHLNYFTFPTQQPRVAQIWIIVPCVTQISLLNIMLEMLMLKV